MRRWMVVLCLSLSVLTCRVFAYSGGTGDPNDPYHITTAQDLIDLGNESNDYGKNFILTADIDLSGHTFARAVIASYKTYNNFALFMDSPFTGSFDGQGHKIYNLHIEGTAYLGLFGRIDTNAVVMNLCLESVNIKGTGRYIGGVAGSNWGNVHCCYSTGSISGFENVGGLVGSNWNANMSSCYSTCEVMGNRSVGGLVGYNGESISNCYSTGAVDGSEEVGGLVGMNWFDSCISNCYSTGKVSGTKEVGGLIGKNYGDESRSLWDTQTSNIEDSQGGTGLSTKAMQNINTFLNAGWDFVGETANGLCNQWQISSGNYPTLSFVCDSNQVILAGSGTIEHPYLIRDIEDLSLVWLQPHKHYRLVENLDLSGITWSNSIIPWFSGTFDGNGHSIRKLSMEGGGFLGLFGRMPSNARVSNLCLNDISIYGNGNFVGGLVGLNDGSIISAKTHGIIKNSNESTSTGGLVGLNSGPIDTSYNECSVNGSYVVGGLAGSNFDDICNCYNIAEVRGDITVGGLVGQNDGHINNCYSSGVVYGFLDVGALVGLNNGGTVSNSFWETQNIGVNQSDGGTGLSRFQMQNINTYLNAGWDFVDETANGTEDIWWMPDNDYPMLWQQEPGRAFVYSGGSGSAEDPFQIATAQDLIDLGNSPDDYDKHFILTANIDLDPTLPGRVVFDRAVIGWDINHDFFFNASPFTGTFDGNGFIIRNLTIAK